MRLQFRELRVDEGDHAALVKVTTLTLQMQDQQSGTKAAEQGLMAGCFGNGSLADDISQLTIQFIEYLLGLQLQSYQGSLSKTCSNNIRTAAACTTLPVSQQPTPFYPI
jgi:hypothetical protein